MSKCKENDNGLLSPSCLVKIFPILTIIGIIFGFFICFNYLKKINYLFLFPDIISSPIIFISLLFFSITILIFIFLLFFLFYCVNKFILYNIDGDKNIDSLFSKNKYLYYISIFYLLFSLLLAIIYFFKLKIYGLEYSSVLWLSIITYLMVNFI